MYILIFQEYEEHIPIEPLPFSTVFLVTAVADLLGSLDAVATSTIGGGAGNVLHELHELSGAFCHGYCSFVW